MTLTTRLTMLSLMLCALLPAQEASSGPYDDIYIDVLYCWEDAPCADLLWTIDHHDVVVDDQGNWGSLYWRYPTLTVWYWGGATYTGTKLANSWCFGGTMVDRDRIREGIWAGCVVD